MGKSVLGAFGDRGTLLSAQTLCGSGNLEMTGHNSYPQITHRLVEEKDVKHVIMKNKSMVF